MSDPSRFVTPLPNSAPSEPGRARPQRVSDNPPRRPSAPLLPVALGLIAGIVLDYYFAMGMWIAASASIVGVIVAWLTPKRPVLPYLAAAFAASGVGALRHDLAFRRVAPDHVTNYLNPERMPLLTSLRGRVRTPPRIIEPREDIPRAYAIGPKTRLLIRAHQLAGVDGPITVSGDVQVTVKAPRSDLREGDLVELTGWLYRPRPPANPGQYDWALALRRNGVLATMSCDHAEVVRVLDRAASSGLLSRLRARARAFLLDEAVAADDAAAGVLEAMVLGQRSAVSRAMNDVFVRTGNVHFLAASGVNIAWLAAFGWGAMRLFGVYYRRAAAAVAAIILSFMLVAEPEPSILRAGLVGLFACLSVMIRGRLHALNWLAGSAIVILFIDPCDLFRSGFQLSFAGVLAVTHVTGVVREVVRRVMRAVPKRARSGDTAPADTALLALTDEDVDSMPSVARIVVKRCVRLVYLAFSATVAAWIVAAPLAAHHFGLFAPWGILGTLVLSPFAMFVTFVGYAKLVLSLVFPPANLVAGPVLAAGVSGMIAIVHQLAKLPGTVFDTGGPSTAWTLATYALIAWRTYRPAWMPVRKGFLALAALIVLGWTLSPFQTPPRDGALRVWMLAVGDGTGTVIELPNGRVLLYDFGTRSPFDAGQVGVAFLQSRGIRRIDAAIVSHSDFDHFSGIERIAEHIPVGRVVMNDQFLVGLGDQSSAAQFVKSMQARRIPIETIAGPHRFTDTGDVLLESIWPPAAEERLLRADNDRSMVLRLEFGGRTILLTGDISEEAMNALVDDPRVRADVLALPHHGSVVATTKRFLEVVDPAAAVRSTGQTRWVTTNGIDKLVGNRRYFSTADDGCVVVTIHRDRIEVEAVMPWRRR